MTTTTDSPVRLTMSAQPTPSPELAELYRGFEHELLVPLWTEIGELMPSSPSPAAVPHVWRYTVFTLAYVFGHGTAALSKGDDPVIALPTGVPLVLLAAGLLPALALAVRAGVRAQRGMSESRKRAEKLLGVAWCTGFTALFLAITGLATARDEPDLQDVLWPAGSVLLVGLITIAEGTVRRNTLHYTLGSWLALAGATALFFDTAGVYATVAIAGGGGYAVAAVLEHRRLTAPR